MASNVNKYLASKLQAPAVSGRGSAAFSDGRTKTATPLPYIETITPGKNQVKGYIGENEIPEVGAYIYIYINGFLINPPSLNPDGSYANGKTAIISDGKGNWETGTFFFSVLPEFQFGQVITFRAKTPMRQISDRSVPYAIGSTPSPIELGIFGEYGDLRAPYEGESSLMGRVSYWMGHLDLNAGKPLFDCSNHVYVYVDGMHVGNNGTVIGEVFRNEIRGTNAQFPIFDSLANHSLSLLVNGNRLDVPLVNMAPIDYGILVGEQNGANTIFTFVQPAPDLGIKIFKNGLRLLEGLDFNYSVDINTRQGVVNFNLDNVLPVQSDRLSIIFQYEAGSLISNQTPFGVIDGSNLSFSISQTPLSETVEVYRNGIHLIQGVHFVSNGTALVFTTGNAPQIGDLLVVDFQPATSPEQFIFPQSLGVADGVSAVFGFNTPNILGAPHVFRNGLLQKEGSFNDYTVTDSGTTFTFTPWAKPEEGDNLLVVFYSTPVVLSQVVDYLNQTTQFKENCLTATTLNIKPLINYAEIEPRPDGLNKYFTLPAQAVDSPFNLRLYKNGIRLYESTNEKVGDFFIDHQNNVIAFFVAPEAGDTLVGLFNYIISDFVVGETPRGAMDGSNSLYTLAMIPKPSTVQVYYNGVRLDPIGPDYVVSSNNITLMNIYPEPGERITVDYEVAFGFQTFTSTIVPSGQITGVNPLFTFPTQNVGTAVHVYKNGLLQRPNGQDYTLNRTNIMFAEGNIPWPGDLLLIEFNNASLFTNNPNDQLRIISPYTLDVKRYADQTQPFGFAGTLLFGDIAELYPGKDADGEFMFWFNRITGYWKWTWYDPNTGITTPFTKGQRITARAKNDRPFIYKIKR